MLLIHGPAEHGVHLFWMDRSGFAKSAFFPADPSSEYEVAQNDDILTVRVTVQGAPAEHAMLWWGP